MSTPRAWPDRLGWTALLVLTAGGIGLRLARLDTIPLHFDALHPFHQALRIAQGVELPWRGIGGGFRFGALQAWVSLPLVVLGSSLRQVLGLNALVHGLGALPLGLAGRAMGGWTGGLLATALYASWPILVSHPHHGAYTYQAPVALALAAWLATRALDQHRPQAVVGLAATLAVAIHLHPYALAPALGALVLWSGLRRLYSWRLLLTGAATGLVVLIPMLIDNAQLLWKRQVREGDVSLVQDAAMANRSPLFVVWDAALQSGAGWPRFAVLAFVLAPLLALGLALWRRPPAPVGPMILWTGTSLGLFLGLAVLLGYTQPYHLAVVLPLGFCAVGWAVGTGVRWTGSRFAGDSGKPGMLGSVGVLIAGGLAIGQTSASGSMLPALSQRHLGTVEQVTDVLLADADHRPRTLALVAETSKITLGDNVAWHLEQWFRGEPDEAFPAEPGFNEAWPRAYVVAELSPEAWQMWPPPSPVLHERTTRGETILRLLVFEDLREAAHWMRQACGLQEAGLEIRVSAPREALGGVAGTTGPHLSLERWAEPCAHPTDRRWLD